MQVRAGTGGDEAALFASDLFRMYQRFAEAQRWRFEVRFMWVLQGAEALQSSCRRPARPGLCRGTVRGL